MRLLFLCTQNRCRSILAEAIAKSMCGDRMQVASAGSHPARKIHPQVIEQLHQRGLDSNGLYCKSWDDLADFNPRAIITLCDSAAEEPCPAPLAGSLRAHWSTPDPAKLKGSDAMRQDAFDATIELLTQRMRLLLQADLEHINDAQLQDLLESIATG